MDNQRPDIPPEDACPSPSFPGMGKYVELMTNCWKQARVAWAPRGWVQTCCCW